MKFRGEFSNSAKSLIQLFGFASLALLSGCGAPSSYMGIPLGSPSASTDYSPSTSDGETSISLTTTEMLSVFSGMLDAGCPADVASNELSVECKQSQQQLMTEAFKQKIAQAPILGVDQSAMALQDITRLAQLAQSGNKQAQLELGIRFEEGRNVPRDIEKARRLYAAAARDSGGRIWVYSPSVGNGTKGRIIPVNTGSKQMGLAEAKRRLEQLQ